MPTQLDLAAVAELVGQVPDPEVPVLTIADLGILRSVERVDDQIVVTITPTYSGCPAMHHIEHEILAVLDSGGIQGRVDMVFTPAWTTDWMSADGQRKLREYGIAPPRPPTSTNHRSVDGDDQHSRTSVHRSGAFEERVLQIRNEAISCPRCSSTTTELISRFGSTACKSLRRCLDCLEPFDHFKEF